MDKIYVVCDKIHSEIPGDRSLPRTISYVAYCAVAAVGACMCLAG